MGIILVDKMDIKAMQMMQKYKIGWIVLAAFVTPCHAEDRQTCANQSMNYGDFLSCTDGLKDNTRDMLMGRQSPESRGPLSASF